MDINKENLDDWIRVWHDGALGNSRSYALLDFLIKERDEALEKLSAMESQEPVAKVFKSSSTGTGIDWAMTGVVPEGTTHLYANPVPSHSQQNADKPKVSCRQCDYYAASAAQCITSGDVREGLIGRCSLSRPIIDRCPSHESGQCGCVDCEEGFPCAFAKTKSNQHAEGE